MLGAPKCQIDPWPSEGWFFSDPVLVLFLGVSPPNQQVSVPEKITEYGVIPSLGKFKLE